LGTLRGSNDALQIAPPASTGSMWEQP
jgi:hypothetical protein